MALPVTIPNQFANATSSIPLSQLDTNFNTLSNAVNGINSGAETLANLVATTANVTTGNITTVNATTVDTTNIEVTNVKAKDGTASATIADSTGVMTIASSVLTTTDINGGTLDNVVIGGANAAAITGTTITADTSVSTDTISEKTSAAGVTIDSVLLKDNKVTANELTINSNNISADNSLGFRNRIINGGFDIAQRGTSFVSGANNDDTYNLDRWYVLSDGNDAVDITQTTTVPTGAKYSIGLDVETANKKFGIAQIIENANCFDGIGQTVTLSFDAKVSSTTKLDNVKCAIVAWSGTADSVTSDIISAWGAEGTNPTLIANATYENSPANLNVTTSFARYTVSAAVDTANTTNIIVFIWSDVTDTTAGDFLYITNVQLEVGSVATPFERRPYGTELVLCQRYCLRVGDGLTGIASNTSAIYLCPFFANPMRASPTSTLWDNSVKISDNYAADYTSSGSTIVESSLSAFGGRININGYAGALTTGRVYQAYGNTDGYVFILSAEL